VLRRWTFERWKGITVWRSGVRRFAMGGEWLIEKGQRHDAFCQETMSLPSLQ
jgi:hypothetical protein